MTILRMAGQVALITGAFWATLSVDPAQGERFLVDAAQSGAAPKDIFVWMLAALVLITGFSMRGIGVSGFSDTIATWCETHWQSLCAGLLGAMALGVYCLV
jgi:hypothetical protein